MSARPLRTTMLHASLGLLLLAGCADRSGTANGSDDDIADDRVEAAGLGSVAAASGLHNITIDVGFTSEGTSGPYAGWDGPECGLAQPTVCQWVGHETMVPTDALVLNGTFLDTAFVRPTPEPGQAMTGTWVFSGTIVGCTGSGTATFPYTAEVDNVPVTPNANGEVVHGHEYLTAPTDAAGLTVPDAWMHAEFHTNPVDISVSDGRLTGYILCR